MTYSLFHSLFYFFLFYPPDRIFSLILILLGIASFCTLRLDDVTGHLVLIVLQTLFKFKFIIVNSIYY